MTTNSIGPNAGLDKSYVLSTGYTITGYQVVVRGTNQGECLPGADDAAPYLGVAQLNPNEGVTLVAGDVVRVRMNGLTYVQAAAAITGNGRVSCIGQGLVDDANPDTAADYFLGIALEPASQLGDIIVIDLTSKNTQYFTS